MKTDLGELSESILGKAVTAEDKRKVRLAMLICYISSVAFPVMGFIAFMQGNNMLAGADFIGLVIMFSLLIHIRKTQKYTLAIQVGAYYFAILCLYLFFTGGVGNSAFVWFYVYPLVGAFLLGSRKGAVVSLSMVLLALIYALSPLKALEPFAHYSNDLLIRFFPSMLVVIFFSYLAERTREQSYVDVVTMAENLYKEKQRVEKATQAKSEFLANMSHEIRTPMTAIIGMTALALKSNLSDYQHKLLNAVKKSSDGLLALLNDILDFSKIEAGQLEFDKHPFSLTELLESVQLTMQFPADEKGLKLIVDRSTEIPDRFFGDELRLQQVLLNLMNNAIKFTHQGQVSVTVQAYQEQLSPESLCICFSVSDTGVGIPKEKQNTIFKSFTQSDTSTARQYGGTGLGLTISKQLIGMMGGDIWVESEEGSGSTFHFTAQLLQDTHEYPDHKPQQQSAAVANLDILLVEDNLLNQELAKIILSQAGHRVEIAPDGLECLKSLAVKSFDVVLMDVQMPKMGGIAACQVIRSCETGNLSQQELPAELLSQLRLRIENTHLPIVAMTANAMKGDREECLAAGMDDYLTKPFQPEQMHMTLKRVIGNNPKN